MTPQAWPEGTVIAAYLAQLKAWLHGTFVGHLPMLETFLGKLIDLFTGPLTGNSTRLYWVELVEALLLAAVVYIAGRQVRPEGGWRGFLRFCFPKGLYTHPSSIVDYQLTVLNACFGSVFNVTWRINSVVMTGLVVAGLTWAFGPAPHALEWTVPLLIGVTALAFVAEDLASYCFHYLEHRIPFLWAIHKVHHSAEVLTPFTATRFHPLEYAFAGASRAVFSSAVLGPVVYLFTGPLAPVQIFGIAATLVVSGALGDVLMHTHVWLSWGPKLNRVFFAPALHQIHHSQAPEHWDRNFGAMLSVWDWMFGTLYNPSQPEKITYGVAGADRQPHGNAIVAWLRPFWDMIPMRDRLVETTGRLGGSRVRAVASRFDMIRWPIGRASASIPFAAPGDSGERFSAPASAIIARPPPAQGQA